MKDYLFRLKYIGLPFIYVCWGTTLLLMLLRWLFSIKFQLLGYTDRTWEVTFAVVMPWPGMLIFLLKRVWALEFRRANGRFGIIFFTFWTLFAMIMSSQTFISTYVGKLLVVDELSAIAKSKPVRYYHIKNYELDRQHAGLVSTCEKSGKRRKHQRLNFSVYVSVPLVMDSAAMGRHRSRYFYAVKFSKSLPINENEGFMKTVRLKEYVAVCLKEIEDRILEKPDHFEYVPDDPQDYQYQRAVAENIYLEQRAEGVILHPIFESYEQRTGITLLVTCCAFGIGSLLLGLMLLSGKLRVNKSF